MARHRPPRKDAVPGQEAGPFHSAFAGLAALRDRLPEGDGPAPGREEVAAPNEPVPPGKLVVRRERKGRKGKTVTRISGLGAGVAEWARRMKQELGCGGSVEGDQVILAGDLVDRAAHWLEAAGVRQVVRGG